MDSRASQAQAGPATGNDGCEQSWMFRAILAASPHLVYVFDRAGRIIYANPAAARAAGQEPAAIIGRPWHELGLEAGGEGLAAQRAAVFASGRPMNGEAHFATAQGIRDYEYVLTPICSPDGSANAVIANATDVTERQRTEERLIEAHSELQAIFRALPDLYFRVASDGTILDYRAGAVQALYAPLAEFMDRRMQDVLPPPVGRRFQEAMRQVLSSRSLVTIEYTLPLPTGEQAFEGRFLPFKGEQIVIIVRNITERKRAEEALAHERDLTAAVIDSASVLVIVLDPQGRIVRFNRTGERTSGYSFADVKGRHFWDLLLVPEEIAQVRAIFDHLVAGRFPNQYENYLATKGGSRRLIAWSNTGIPDSQGAIAYVVSIGIDITERRQAEHERQRLLSEVQRRAAELSTTLASIADGLIIYGPTGEIVRMNAAAEQLLGLSPEERRLPLADWLALLQVETPQGRPFPLEETPTYRALRGETVLGAVLVLHRRPDRPRWISSSAAPIRAVNGQLLGAVVTFTDVTVLHELQEQREDILRAVSHDLRSPLTVVQTQAQLLLRALDRAGLAGGERRSAEAIIASSRRMNTMIQELVDAIRLESGQLLLHRGPVDLASFILDLRQRLAGVLETGRIRVQAPAGLPPALADPDRLERILTNLLSNALKYSTPGTEVTVSLYRQDGQVIIAVSDRGPGIPPADLPHIFDRYYRATATRQRHEGLGLGLYISKRLIEVQGGHISAESTVGQGSTFRFSLPLGN